MTARKRVNRLLRVAMASNELVVVSRSLKYAGRYRGFVVGIGSKWTLLREIDDAGAFDGYVALRIRDIHKIRPDKTFAVRAAPQLPHWPPVPPVEAVELGNTRGLLVSFARASESGLIGIEKEQERDAQWIGVFDEIIGKYVYLLEVHPSAEWHKQPLGYRVRDITSVGVGGLYRNALARYIDWEAKPTAQNYARKPR